MILWEFVGKVFGQIFKNSSLKSRDLAYESSNRISEKKREFASRFYFLGHLTEISHCGFRLWSDWEHGHTLGPLRAVSGKKCTFFLKEISQNEKSRGCARCFFRKVLPKGLCDVWQNSHFPKPELAALLQGKKILLWPSCTTRSQEHLWFLARWAPLR